MEFQLEVSIFHQTIMDGRNQFPDMTSIYRFTSWFLTKDVTGLSPFTAMKNILIAGFTELSENI